MAATRSSVAVTPETLKNGVGYRQELSVKKHENGQKGGESALGAQHRQRLPPSRWVFQIGGRNQGGSRSGIEAARGRKSATGRFVRSRSGFVNIVDTPWAAVDHPSSVCSSPVQPFSRGQANHPRHRVGRQVKGASPLIPSPVKPLSRARSSMPVPGHATGQPRRPCCL